MPPRHITLAIIAVWVAMSGWLFYSELWPRLRPGEPPTNLIDLNDEAQLKESAIRWTLYYNGRETGYAITSVEYQERDDTFRLKAEFKWRRENAQGDPRLEAYSMYRVTRLGELRELSAKVIGRPGFLGMLTAEIGLEVWGQAEDGLLRLHVSSSPRIPFLPDELTPVRVVNSASLVNTMQPFNRIRGLYKGRHWQCSELDPTSALFARMNPIRTLAADVTEHELQWPYGSEGPKTKVACYVIEYKGADSEEATTWVRKSDGIVLMQEGKFAGNHAVLRRDLDH